MAHRLMPKFLLFELIFHCMQSKQISILLIDDHPVVRAGYRRLLESSSSGIKVVAEADNGEVGCELYREYVPDVVILDLKMPPGIDGLETIRRIKAKDQAARILVFSMYCNEILLQRVLQAGAIGYLTKQSGSDQMIKAVCQVNQGQRYIDQKLAKNNIIKSILGGDTDYLINTNTGNTIAVYSLPS